MKIIFEMFIKVAKRSVLGLKIVSVLAVGFKDSISIGFKDSISVGCKDSVSVGRWVKGQCQV